MHTCVYVSVWFICLLCCMLLLCIHVNPFGPKHVWSFCCLVLKHLHWSVLCLSYDALTGLVELLPCCYLSFVHLVEAVCMWVGSSWVCTMILETLRQYTCVHGHMCVCRLLRSKLLYPVFPYCLRCWGNTHVHVYVCIYRLSGMNTRMSLPVRKKEKQPKLPEATIF